MSTPVMRYRRFGRTELKMPVFSCGGMRYQHKWSDLPLEEIPADNQANLEATIQRSLELGINHIETARGYGTSEMQLGQMLPKLPREKLIVQTKVAPHADPQEFLATFKKSMEYLQIEHVDLLAFHGINNRELLEKAKGCLSVARQIQKEGRARYLGFSTHGLTSTIMEAVESGEFDYINLHWYFVNESHWAAIEAATRRDMGVFIISPSDKGGKLYEPSPKLSALCQPLSPIAFNDLFCLRHPQVHTLSIGAERPEDFDAHLAALEYYDDIASAIEPIETRLRKEMESTLGAAWCAHWEQGLPDFHELPQQLNLREILRLWNFAKALDMVDWGKMRYNLLGSGGDWFPGQHVGTLEESDWKALATKIQHSPFAAQLPAILREAHEMLAGEAMKRLSESD